MSKVLKNEKTGKLQVFTCRVLRSYATTVFKQLKIHGDVFSWWKFQIEGRKADGNERGHPHFWERMGDVIDLSEEKDSDLTDSMDDIDYLKDTEDIDLTEDDIIYIMEGVDELIDAIVEDEIMKDVR